MKTTTTLLEDDRAQLSVEVPADRVEHDLQHTLHHLADDVKLPGFRKGKVPTQVVLQRLGREEVFVETLREHLMRWFRDAVSTTSLKPVGQPEVDWDALPPAGEPFRFTATFGLRPKGTLPTPLHFDAPRHDAGVPEEDVAAELEQLRDSGSPLRPVERPAAEGDFVEVDFSARVGKRAVDGASASGYHAQLGSNRLIPELEAAVLGRSAGDDAEVPVEFPADYPNKALAGKEATFDVHLHAVSEREPRELDDALARDVSEFDTLADLRADVERSLQEQLQAAVEAQYRREVLAGLGRVVEVELPGELVAEKVDELIFALARNFEGRGVSLADWLARTGQGPEVIREQLQAEAVETLRQEIALEALAEREAVEIDDDRLLELMREDAEGEPNAEELVQEVLASSAKERVREDLRLRLALDRAVELATPITYEQAAARQKLWTPEQEEASAPEKPELWTPGQPR